jgi:LPPG:FO 2-phospho-L-lactate transferase
VIVALCGGFGAARFVTGLVDALEMHDELVCVANGGDDFEHLGLTICPDLDSVTYALAKRFDEDRGFGLAGDTFHCNAALDRYGHSWFLMGDEDLAHSLARTTFLTAGMTLSQATVEVNAPWALRAQAIPMSDDPVRTRIQTPLGELSFQDFVIGHRAEPPITGIRYEGIDQAKPAPGVLALLENASVVLLAPSNPISSLRPILELPGVEDTLRQRTKPTVAISPVVSGLAPKTQAEQHRAKIRAAMMNYVGLPHTAYGIAGLYRGLCDGFVLDQRDADQSDSISALGIDVCCADTLASPADRVALAATVLAFGNELCGTRAPNATCTEQIMRSLSS